jgi:hypothetical protein
MGKIKELAIGTFWTTTIVVVPNVSLRMTDRATGMGFPWVCACATGSCATLSLVGLLTGSDVIAVLIHYNFNKFVSN